MGSGSRLKLWQETVPADIFLVVVVVVVALDFVDVLVLVVVLDSLLDEEGSEASS